MQPCPSAERSFFSAGARALLMLLQEPEEIVSPVATDLRTRRKAKSEMLMHFWSCRYQHDKHGEKWGKHGRQAQ